jgi:hypothetical protein
MGLADAINETRTKVSHPLRADVLLAELDPADAEAFKAALRDRSLSADRLSAAMSANGTPLSQGPINLWRRRNLPEVDV